MRQLVTFITLQDFAGIISFSGGALVVAVVIFLIATSTKSEDKTSVKHKVYKIRGQYFFGLVLAIIVFLFISLRLLPYPHFQGKADEVVTVVGIQWSWKMAHGESDKKPAEFIGPDSISVTVNKRIEFVVESADVNHDFAIYNDKGVLLAQTQSMPGYKNRLQHVFTQKGVYHILCLEYCGLAHAYMMGTIHVN